MMQPSEVMKNRQKRKSTYFVDRKLCPRIKEYLEATRVSANADDIVNYLQTSFNEYARKKRHVLMLSVQKALQNQLASYLPDKTQLLEENHLRKRQKKSNDEDESTSGSSSEEEILVEYKDSNALNNSMQDLYRKTVPSPKPCLKKEEENWAVDKTHSLDVHVNTAETPKQVNNEVNEEKKTVEEQKQTPATKNKDENSDLSKTPSKLKSSRKSTAAKEKVKKFASSVSTVTFKDIGGYETSIEAVSKLLLHLKHPEVFTRLGIQPPRGFLLQGAPGCGKSLLAHAIAGELQLPFFSIAATEVVSGISGESEQKIRELFTEATLNAPSIVFIDEIDSITPKREVAGKESERRVVTQILSCMDELMKIDSHVLVIGATSRADSIDPALRRAGRFDREIAMGIPTASTRKKILQVICRDMRLEEGFDFDAVANQTPGFVGADLQALAREAAMCAVESVFKSQLVAKTLFTETHETKPESNTESGSCDWLRDQPPLGEEQLSTLFLTTQHFQEALGHVQPSAKREGFATVPDVTWKDIGALEDVREELTMAIMAPVRNPEAFESLGLQTPPGILLAGPPGCGKTLLAKAIANEAGINFISVKGPELLNMYVGESEKAVRQVFQRARNSSPCVIFFDEIDALCPRRSQTGDSSASSRVVNQLLTEMDGVQTRKQVFIMGATNRPDILDAAILRPGRLDKLLFVGLPNVEDREKILNTITKNGKKPEFADDITVKQLAEDVRTEGFSGADLNAVVREASVAALKEFMKADRKKTTEQSTGQKETTEQSTDHKETTEQSTDQKEHPSDNMETENSTDRSGKILLRCKHFDVAFEKVKPSVSGTDRVWYDDMKERNVRRK